MVSWIGLLLHNFSSEIACAIIACAIAIGFGPIRLPSNCECFPANYSLV